MYEDLVEQRFEKVHIDYFLRWDELWFAEVNFKGKPVRFDVFRVLLQLSHWFRCELQEKCVVMRMRVVFNFDSFEGLFEFSNVPFS